jgi:hypothetical protein
MMAQCIQEEGRLKNQLGDSVSFAQHQAKKKNKFSKQNFKKPGAPRVSSSRPPQRPENHGKMKIFLVDIDTCMYCKEKGHYKKNCLEFLKYLLKNSNDQVTFIDESLFLEFSTSTWCIDSGATIHVANSLQGLSIRRELAKGQRSIRVANDVEAEVKAIGDLAIELDDGSVLNLYNVLFVPSLRRNLISVSCFHDENIHCHFGDRKCIMKYDGIDVGLAIRQEKLYLLPRFSVVNEISDTPPEMSEQGTKRKRNDDEASSKLWHYWLGHISRGRIERLVKEKILQLLDFTNLEKCVDCINGTFVKKMKKDAAKRSASVLEIIHIDICGPFNVKIVDGFDSFITLTDDYSRYGYIYPIKERSKALDKFKIFKAEVENQLDKKIKIVRSDRGGSTTVTVLHMDKCLDLLWGTCKKMV